MLICPRCGSDHVIKNSPIHTGKPISAETKALIDKLLLERVSLAGIVRVAVVSAQGLQDYVHAKYAAQPQVADILIQKTQVSSAKSDFQL